MLLSTAGRPLICPVLSPDKHTSNASLMRQITQPTAGWVVAEDDSHGGKNAIVGSAPVQLPVALARESLGGNGVQWIAFVRQDPKETFAPLNQLIWKVSAGAIGVFVLMLVAGRFLARRIVRPIQVLQEGAALIGRGELNHRLDITTGDEIEKLAAIRLKRSEEHTSELQSQSNLVCRLLLEKKKIVNTKQLHATNTCITTARC